MLSSRARLCNGCRRDLLSLLERGFCGPPVPRIARSPPRKLARYTVQHTRPLSVSVRARNLRSEPDHHETPSPLPEGSEGVRPLTENELSAKFETLQKWEEFDGEDSVAHECEEKTKPEGDKNEPVTVLHPQAAAESIQEDFQKQLEEWRTSGVDTDDIVREARQTFGDVLPEELLSEQETQIYRRLYGEPLPPPQDAEPLEETLLLDKGGDEVQYTMVRSPPQTPGELHALEEWLDSETAVGDEANDSGAAEMEEDLDEPMELEPGQDIPWEYQESDEERQHPMTALGKFQTTPRTLHMPQEHYTMPVNNVMASFSNKQLKDVCERTFGGPGLPDSALTPRSGRTRPQVAVQLEASQHFMGEMEATAFMTTIVPPAFAAASATLSDARKRLGPTWLTELLAKEGGPRVLDAGAGGAGILAWNEIVRAHWEALHTSDAAPNPPPASKAVVLTGSNPLRHRAAQFLDNTTFVPRLPDYIHTRGRETMDDDRPVQQRKQFDVIISSYSLLPFKEDWEKKQYVQNLWALLSTEGGVLILIEKGIPRGFESIASARELLLERYIATPPNQDTYYTPQHNKAESDGAPWTPETGMIIGPCSNHERCPMYKIQGISLGRKDICSFQQRYIRPGHLQRVLGASSRNHDDVDFSYLSIMKGRDLRRSSFTEWSHVNDPLSAPTSTLRNDSTTADGIPASNTDEWLDHCQSGWDTSRPDTSETSSTSQSLSTIDPTPTFAPAHSLPRLVFPPMKRRGHAILDVCTPTGAIERWTVPRSFGKQAFRDARKARWGDLWALGAKTRIARETRQGSGKDRLAEQVLRGKRTGRGREEKMRNEVTRLREREELEREGDREDRRIDEMLAARGEAREFDTGDSFDDSFDDDVLQDQYFGLGPDITIKSKTQTRTTKKGVPVHRRDAKPGTGSADAKWDLLAEQDALHEERARSGADEDELDREIELKLKAWEEELTDRRPRDKKGKLIKGGRRAKKMQQEEEAREAGAEVEWRPAGGGGGGAAGGAGVGEEEGRE